MMRQVLHIDMDAFFASVEQQTFPFLRGRPIGVCSHPQGRTVIATASYEARAYGVKTAMTIPQARKLCPEITLVRCNLAKYIDTSTRIMAICSRFTDSVEVFSIDEAFLDVTNTAHLFGGADTIARKIKQELSGRFGLTCSIGIAPNKLLAKLVGEMHKPDGLTIIRPEEVPVLLEKIIVEEMCGIGPKTAAKLHRLGIKSCGELGRYPEKALVRIFGVKGVHLHHIGKGIDESPVRPYFHKPPAKSMGHSMTFDKDTRNMAIIRHHLFQLSEQVGRRLRKDNYAGRTVSLVLRYADFTTMVRQHSLKNWTNDGRRIYQTGLALFYKLYQPPRYVRLIGISVSNLIQQTRQTSMFEHPETLRSAVDNLNNRFGEFRVTRAQNMNK
ncbi:DNA polymerase IV [candidate division WOR-3 bacterium JGI_Cruoil_03_51_56]|uniref:DNA polymerase IV n=2 Tax=candidate division WOR-3 bacterium JGI_Cruoil_03_51_56 TaxID=1973747 RepID=A0A235BQY6_UNCW3|nr:MAG: DNA polymerase IV [candidate division WOR-3 bacterium JGI_Cruoil_03_51_56]